MSIDMDKERRRANLAAMLNGYTLTKRELQNSP